MALSAKVESCYRAWIWILDGLKHLFLLIVRLYFGWGFFVAGKGKLEHVATTTEAFAGWGIPMPEINVYMAGTTEMVCGVLLLVGFASRIITIPLIGTMIVAFLTAHKETLPWHTNWNIAQIFTAGAFPYLFACLIVLVFGPGLFSVDGLIRMIREEPGSAGPATVPGADQDASRPAPNVPQYAAGRNRREMIRLAVAALGGLTAGAIAGYSFHKPAPPGDKPAPPGDTNDKGESAAAPLPRLLQDPHICRGINTGKNDGKKGTTNECAGQGHCATLPSHVCQGMNDCKGQGGCGNNPGENECKEKGSCQIPLKADTWVKARKRFEELMNKANKKFGAAPAA